MARGKTSAGALRHLVTIQTATRSTDSRGGFSESWATYTTAYANIEPASAGEGYAAGQVSSTRTHKITMRYATGIRPAMRISWNSRTFLIEGVRTVGEENRLLVLDCIEERT